MLLRVELVSEIDVSFAVEEIAENQAGPLQMYRVDLEVAPVERAIVVVMVDLALACRVLRPLYRQCYAAG